ncbi:CspA family cold shock protein [Rhodobacteraceae bacterium NNCM2]|nr:CspA family cold shock protein [Coraliihabitans acroporae]
MTEMDIGTEKVVSGHVKWYDAVKGYGFVVPDDDSEGDIMVHASCVRAFGIMNLAEGAKVKIVSERGQRGMHAQRLLEVEEPAEQEAFSGFSEARPTEFLGKEVEVGPLVPARVKWFDKQKGFGFVNVYGNPEDVFVHMETVRRSGFQDLAGGEGMACRTFRGPRGLMVAELRLWEASVDSSEGSDSK